MMKKVAIVRLRWDDNYQATATTIATTCAIVTWHLLLLSKHFFMFSVHQLLNLLP